MATVKEKVTSVLEFARSELQIAVHFVPNSVLNNQLEKALGDGTSNFDRLEVSVKEKAHAYCVCQGMISDGLRKVLFEVQVSVPRELVENLEYPNQLCGKF